MKILLAILPPILIAYYIYQKDNYFLFLGQAQYLSMFALIIAIYYSKKALNNHVKDSQIRNFSK